MKLIRPIPCVFTSMGNFFCNTVEVSQLSHFCGVTQVKFNPNFIVLRENV